MMCADALRLAEANILVGGMSSAFCKEGVLKDNIGRIGSLLFRGRYNENNEL